jgi:alkaline phosphatase D
MLASIEGRAPRNTVFVGGDIHQNYVCDLHARDDIRAPVIASEFCGTSISSQWSASPARLATLVQHNPQIVFANSEKRGYGLVELTPRGAQTTLRVVDHIEHADSAVSTLASFAVEDGKPGVVRR